MENVKKPYKNKKIKISAPMWNEELELPNELCSVSDIQDYFEYIIKKTSKSDWKSSNKNISNQNRK